MTRVAHRGTGLAADCGHLRAARKRALLCCFVAALAAPAAGIASAQFYQPLAASLAHAVRAAREPFAELARARLDDVEALYLEKLMATRDAKEGLAAFMEKRAPKWEHR